MARQTTTPDVKRVQINTSVSPEVAAALNKYRHKNEIERRGDVLALAVTEFLDNHGIVVAEAPADATE